MRECDFINSVSKLTEYNWLVKYGRVFGKCRNGRARGSTFNAITALARSQRLASVSSASDSDTEKAAKALKLPDSIVNALNSGDTCGYAQVLRGRLMRSVGLRNSHENS